jgi:hypothetical protein
VAAFGAGNHLPSQESRIVPTNVDQAPPFDGPGVREAGPGRHAPAVFSWRPWIALAFVLIGLAYGPSLVRLAVETPFDAPGLRVW